MAEKLKEQLTKRKKIIWLIIILLLLLILAAIIYLFLVYFKKLPGISNQNLNLNQAPVPVVQNNVFNTPNAGVLADVQGLTGQIATSEAAKQSVLFIATSFTERFGTYSNQSNYKNFDELAVFMTDSMKKWVLSYQEDLKKKNPDINVYYALETKAISSQINTLDEKTGKGEILVKTQRQELKNSPANPRIFYQDILLKLVKINNEWKVDGAYWQ